MLTSEIRTQVARMIASSDALVKIGDSVAAAEVKAAAKLMWDAHKARPAA